MSRGNFKVMVTVRHPQLSHGAGHDRWSEDVPDTHFDFHTPICPQAGDVIELDGKRYKVYSAPRYIVKSEYNGGEWSHNALSHLELIVNPT